MCLGFTGQVFEWSHSAAIPQNPLDGFPNLRHDSETGGDAAMPPIRHHGNHRPIHERFPKQGRAHQAVDYGRRLIRIDCNHGLAADEKSRIYTADAMLAVRIEQLTLNPPNTKEAA